MEQIQGGVTAPKGFLAASAAAGIKYENRTDMAMLYSEQPCAAAGTFTTNVVKAAPVLWDKNLVENETNAQAVVVNSGIANACTGREGMECCEAVAEETGRLLQIPKESVLLGSTGEIGVQIPVEKLKASLVVLKDNLQPELEAGTKAAKAIMTTDTHHKEIAFSFQVGGVTATIGGMCKGSGMIHPNMCTMLAYITTDVAISKKLLQEALQEDIQDTFNMVSVDGDTSTNDTVLLLANGMAGNKEITDKDENYHIFQEALRAVNTFLAKQMAGDGEGATALFEVKVEGAKTKADAIALSKSVVSSSLVKTAIAGHDANWGRIFCALGYSGVDFEPGKVELQFISSAGKIIIAQNGVAVKFSEEEATAILSQEEITAYIHMHIGNEAATAWGCDLTHEYISINADYRSENFVRKNNRIKEE